MLGRIRSFVNGLGMASLGLYAIGTVYAAHGVSSAVADYATGGLPFFSDIGMTAGGIACALAGHMASRRSLAGSMHTPDESGVIEAKYRVLGDPQLPPRLE